MAIGLVLTFDGVTKEQYDQVMGELGLESPGNSGAGSAWPKGIVSHVAGTTDAGWCVVDVWDSQESFDAFMGSRLGAAMAKVGVPEPDVTAFEVYNSHSE